MFVSSNLEMNSNVKPKLAGSQVLFATDYFGFTHFREHNYYNQRNAKQGVKLSSAFDITKYVPKYIEGSITHWDAVKTLTLLSSPQRTSALSTNTKGNRRGSQQKIQRSWVNGISTKRSSG